MKPGYADPMAALGMCLIEAKLHSSKHAQGLVRVTGRDYPGREHWASYDPATAQVTDLTLRQFSTKAPKSWRGTLDDWLDDMCEYLVDGLDYEIYQGTNTDLRPIVTDFWIRDDIEPGPMHRPWDLT